MIQFKSSLIFFILALLLASCTSTSPPKQASFETEHININNRVELAKAAYKEKNYYEAHLQWKILLAIQPENKEFQNRARVLGRLIQRRIKTNLKAARDALKENNDGEAEKYYLKALALDPGNKRAFNQLKEIEKRRVESRQALKIATLVKKRRMKLEQQEEESATNNETSSQELAYLELGINLFEQSDWSGSIREISKYLMTNQNDSIAKKYLGRAHIALSELLERRGHLEPAIQHFEAGIENFGETPEEKKDKLNELKTKIANKYYIDGVRIYRKDIDQAVAFWKRAINFDPQHYKAKSRLQKAEQIKSGLKKIQ